MDGQTPESWNGILDQFADASIYQSWAYGAVRWGANNLSHLVLRRNGQIVAGAQLRIARLPLLPVGIAYVRWGPLCQTKSRTIDSNVVAEMLAHLRNEYVTRRGLALQIIPHTFSTTACAGAFLSAFERSGLTPDSSLGHYRTILVDLAPTTEAMRKRLNQKWRNQLNRAEKNGLFLEVSDGADAYRDFLRLYESMQTRKHFSSSVDVKEFGRMQEILQSPAKMSIFLAKEHGETIGALVCSFVGETAIYLLGATNQQARELKASYLLHWQAMLWLKDRGARWYDLGGIDPEANPGGYHFKSGLGGSEAALVPAHGCTEGMLSRGVAAFIKWRRREQLITREPTPVSVTI